MNQPSALYFSANENQNIRTEKVLCQEINRSLMVQFDNLSSLNRDNAQLVFQKIKQHLSYDKNTFLDLRGINSIDAQGLAFLIQLNKKIHSLRGKLTITNPSIVLQKIFWITEIDRIIKVRINTEKLNTIKVLS